MAVEKAPNDGYIRLMTKASPAHLALPPAAAKALAALGRDIAVARRRRRLPQRLMAEKMMVNVETLQRLERGDPKVGIGIVASALFVLGLIRRLEDLVPPASDVQGEAEALRRLPRRVRAPAAPDLDF